MLTAKGPQDYNGVLDDTKLEVLVSDLLLCVVQYLINRHQSDNECLVGGDGCCELRSTVCFFVLESKENGRVSEKLRVGERSTLINFFPSPISSRRVPILTKGKGFSLKSIFPIF